MCSECGCSRASLCPCTVVTRMRPERSHIAISRSLRTGNSESRSFSAPLSTKTGGLSLCFNQFGRSRVKVIFCMKILGILLGKASIVRKDE